MKAITAPINTNSPREIIANLQEALQMCLDRGAILGNDPNARQSLAQALRPERERQSYGRATVRALSIFQRERNLQQSEVVDEPTANSLNTLLTEWGVLDQPTQRWSCAVSGLVRREEGEPLQGRRVRAVHEAAAGSLRLGEDNTDAEGRYTIRYEPLPGVDGINLRVTVFNADGKPHHESEVIRQAKALEIVDFAVPGSDLTSYRVEGKVTSRVRASLSGLQVVIVDKGVGGDVELARATTDDSGAYQVTFPDSDLRRRGKAQPDLQARVLAGDSYLAASDVRYNATQHEVLDVLLQDKVALALRSEHEALRGALARHYTGKLGDLKETDEQRDITYLANKTGWDARAVALAALSDQFSTRTTDPAGVAPPIPQAFFYALFRAGLPANEETLYHTDARTLEAAWKTALEQGIIQASADQIPNLIRRFQALSAQRLMTGPALVGASSFKETLAVSRLSDAQQAKFAELYAANRADMAAFWKGARQAFGEQTTNRLQVDGKLGFLTINNASLMQQVHATAGTTGLADPVELAQRGFYKAEPWNQLLTEDVPVPKEIPGDTPESKRENYTAYLAAQVRLSYPTAAVAHMVKSGELPLLDPARDASDQVHAFLTQHQGKFEIGVQPVQSYIAKNNLQVSADTVQQVKRLERVYQITPSDQALAGLMKRGIDAAYHVVRYDKDTFVQSFGADLGGAEQAAATYEKSLQVHNTVLSVALSYLNARTAPAIGMQSPAGILDPAPANAGDVIAYATLESLFGSMDFCACEHCRSILSPAAYLVDLLQFLHADENEWTDFCNNWRSAHGAPYPFPNQAAFHAAGQPENTEISPLDVLLSRRPDIEHLPLTCENTNTALPYIDVVNETLEYFIANRTQRLSLNGYLGHSTDGGASEDLLASPQFVIDSAYSTLRDERFPAPLPFHQPLENLRRYFRKFEVPLPLAMERLSKTNDLERGANIYGWRDILMEEIDLSRAEYEILTDSNAVPLPRMYGFPNETAETAVRAGLSNAKACARRVGITYEALISVLKTRFINPNGHLGPKLERLGVSFETLKALKDGEITGAAFDDLLSTGLTAPDPAEYGGDIKAWVKNEYTRIIGLIILAVPAGKWAASKTYALGDFVRPKTAQSESALYFECTDPGKSATTEPNWPTTPGKTRRDNTVKWTCRDASSCQSFHHLAFRRSDPLKLTENISAAEFVRLLRFIRLWKKLGWTIEETDAAICALYRADLDPLRAEHINTIEELDKGFKTLLPRLGVVIRVMNALKLTPKRDLQQLLACWTQIGTYGETALYRQMFLSSAPSKQDTLFGDSGRGEFLRRPEVPYEHPQPTLEQPIVVAADGKIGYNDSTKRLSYDGLLGRTIRDALKAVPEVSDEFKRAVDALYRLQRLATHAETLRSAFNLTGDEYDRIVAALDYGADESLTIPNISAINRRGWLARKLKLSVRELLLLIRLTDLDPFAAPDPTTPAMLRLISLAQTLKDGSLKPAAALYLIWNQDLSGRSAPDSAQVAALAKTLRTGFAAFETEFAVADDPDGAILQAQLAKVYGAEAATLFFGLLNDTLTLEVEFSDPNGILVTGATWQAIENAAGKTEADASRIAYDDFRKRLSFSGVLTLNTRNAIKLAAGAGAAAFKKAMDELHKKNSAIISPFFARYPELQFAYDDYVANTSHSISEKREILLKAILPGLVKRRKRQQALQSVSAAVNTDLEFSQAFLDPPVAPFPLHAAREVGQPALNDFLALEKQGLSVEFFASDTATGEVIRFPDIASSLDYSKPGNPLPANPTQGAAISGVWRGYLEAPESGFFNFRIKADLSATVTLELDEKPVALAQNGTLWSNATPIELGAGTLYPLTLTVEKVRNVVRVQWEWEPKGQGLTVIPARYLYPATRFEAFNSAYVRFLKAASLAAGLGLTANEMAYFATHSDYQIGPEGLKEGWLNVLSVSGDPAPKTAPILLKPFEALLDFARIKKEISPQDESLLTVLKDAAMDNQTPDSLLFTITRWNQTWFTDVIAHFGDMAGLGHFDLFRRVYDALALVRKMGIPAKALIEATTNEPASGTIREFGAALRARYDAASWRDVVRPINDEMRTLQRDALVGYILHQMRSHNDSAHIDTPDKLFEFFLEDVQMEASMQTSRIRHALSAVQLFIERCLMNLEPRVSPAAINAKRWEWMKRYRVWEANRKVYLFPENWLEPELRDDKSPFFKEIESELLQSDITDDAARTAVLNYLAKLEEVAKLEPCGMYHTPADPANGTAETDHVVARTPGAKRKYYYRRQEYGYWTPWEQIQLDIEDNPVIPVVWNDRLLLFWLRLLKKGPETAMIPPPGPPPAGKKLTDLTTNDFHLLGNPQITPQAVLCWSEFYNGKWQPAKTSSINLPTNLPAYFFYLTVFRLGVAVEGDALRVYVGGTFPHEPGFWPGSFLFYNTHSLPVRGENAGSQRPSPSGSERRRKLAYFDRNIDPFGFDYSLFSHTHGQVLEFTRQIFKAQIPFEFADPIHEMQNIWAAPAFFADSRHVFLVTSVEQPALIRSQSGYGLFDNAGVLRAAQVPPLLRAAATAGPKSWANGGSSDFEESRSAPIRRFITQDACIPPGAGSTLDIKYGDRYIGPSGVISKNNT